MGLALNSEWSEVREITLPKNELSLYRQVIDAAQQKAPRPSSRRRG